jgi:hypothetical protein
MPVVRLRKSTSVQFCSIIFFFCIIFMYDFLEYSTEIFYFNKLPPYFSLQSLYKSMSWPFYFPSPSYTPTTHSILWTESKKSILINFLLFFSSKALQVHVIVSFFDLITLRKLQRWPHYMATTCSILSTESRVNFNKLPLYFFLQSLFFTNPYMSWTWWYPSLISLI